MKFQLEVQDNKVNFFLELIKGFKFIKAQPVDADNEVELSKELKATLDDRLREYEENPNEGQSWKEVRKQITSK